MQQLREALENKTEKALSFVGAPTLNYENPIWPSQGGIFQNEGCPGAAVGRHFPGAQCKQPSGSGTSSHARGATRSEPFRLWATSSNPPRAATSPTAHRCSSPLPGALHPLSCPRVNAAFRLSANGEEGGSWRVGVLPCHLGPYRQRSLREISSLNQLLHRTPEEQQTDSALKHKHTSTLSAAQAKGRTVYLISSMEIKLKNKNIHLQIQKRKIPAC